MIDSILEARRASKRADAANKRATQAMRDAVLWLHDRGYPLRDIGFIFGFSYQRAQQILKAAQR